MWRLAVPTAEQPARLAEAFAQWDTAGDGTICASDLGDVLQGVGRTLSPGQTVCHIPGAAGQRISFDGFLEIASAADTWQGPHDRWQDLLVTLSLFDDGHGYISLPDLILAVDEHLKVSYCSFTDDQLLGMYRKAFDVAVFETPNANMTPEAKWEIFIQEFAASRQEYSLQPVTPDTVCDPTLFAASCYGTSNQDEVAGLFEQQLADPDDPVSLIVADLGGETLASHTLPSSCLVEDLKQHIQNVLGVPASRQLLLLEGQVLPREDFTLLEAGLCDGASLTLVAKEDIKVDYAHFAGELMNFL